LNTIFFELINPHADPKAVVHDAFSRIVKFREDYDIPIQGFSEAPAKLQREGVTFLVELVCGGKIEKVPFRVENEAVVRTVFCSKRRMASWRGRVIHSITVHVKQTVGELMKKISQYLRTSLHRFQRRLQKQLHIQRIREGRARFDGHYYRTCREQVACH
jgi:hypothetical protein